MEIKLEPYQLEIFLNLSLKKLNRIISLKSRQVGMTWLMALYMLIMCQIRGDTYGIIVSYVRQQTQKTITDIKELYKLIPEEYRVPIVGNAKGKIEFKNGAMIEVFSKGDIKGGNSNKFVIVLIDELALYGSDDKATVNSLNGNLVRSKYGSSFVILSNPLFKKGIFFDIWDDTKKYKNYRRYLIRWWNYTGLVKEGLWKKAQIEAPLLPTEERVKRFGNESLADYYNDMSLDAFKQDFEAEFLDNDIACYFGAMDEYYLKNGQYCETLEEIKEKYENYSLYGGYDIASVSGADKSAVFIIADVNGILIPVYKKEYKLKFRQQKKILREMFETIDLESFYIEQNGIGMELAEDLEDEFSFIFKHTTTQKTKTGDFALIKKMLEEKTLKLIEDRDFMLQMYSVKLKQARNGKPQIVIERNESGHGDAVMAMSLAVRAWKQGQKDENFGFGFGRY
ncbi:terminase family protein [Clostridium sp. JN-9]|uniref:phage terminase large subunit family protein n=1 Tax=Clostridium sp. JN-9 TaxID=2507159 RepID=UPI00196B6459|nr:terminase family protein [Clostridium sp. JN-9]